jgi:hypothetical protein
VWLFWSDRAGGAARSEVMAHGSGQAWPGLGVIGALVP